MKVLVINSGSSSIKYRLFDMVDKSVLATGLLEQIGETGCRLTHRSRSAQGDMAEIIKTPPVENHQALSIDNSHRRVAQIGSIPRKEAVF